MNTAILISVAIACAAGLTTGFHRGMWQISLLISAVAAPLGAAIVFAALLRAPSFGASVGWASITFMYCFLTGFFAWGACAGLHHLVVVMHRKLTRRSRADRPQAAGR